MLQSLSGVCSVAGLNCNCVAIPERKYILKHLLYFTDRHEEPSISAYVCEHTKVVHFSACRPEPASQPASQPDIQPDSQTDSQRDGLCRQAGADEQTSSCPAWRTSACYCQNWLNCRV